MKQRLNQLLAKNTGQSLAKVEKDTDRDFWLSPEEAKQYGVIDEIIKNGKESGK
jgi:ATP-dependent Clp protease protease subunit